MTQEDFSSKNTGNTFTEASWGKYNLNTSSLEKEELESQKAKRCVCMCTCACACVVHVYNCCLQEWFLVGHCFHVPILSNHHSS